MGTPLKLAALALLLSGCRPDTCESDTECEEGTHCVASLCQALPPAEPPPPPVDERCDLDGAIPCPVSNAGPSPPPESLDPCGPEGLASGRCPVEDGGEGEGEPAPCAKGESAEDGRCEAPATGGSSASPPDCDADEDGRCA